MSKPRQDRVPDRVESGFAAREQEKKLFLKLADRLARSSDVKDQKRLKAELARMTHGE